MSLTRAFQLPYQLISISGQEQLSYLHGQLTQDMNLITDEQFMWAGHCSPKGKLWGAFRVFKFNDHFFMMGSESEVAASARELKKYGVFAQVDIHHLASPNIIGILTDNETKTCELLGLNFANSNACEFANQKALRLDENRIVLYVDEHFNLPAEITLSDEHHAFTEATIIAGEPQLSDGMVEEFVPQMINLQAIGGISFKKGCYTGQETVARMRYLGKNKRAMYILQGSNDKAFSETDVEIQLGENWRRAGKIINQVYNSKTQKYSALAVLPNDTDVTSTLRAKHSPEVSMSILPLPYSLEDDK
ncbi:folate-binding protein YgfZ [Pseudoalteromonas sp. MMG005]|uniref:CAF17-like 4Fe-4S cluster assembly/insertion protein YgfZ n=1 Tax=Pseudoalteromonas sp. MMG005 TaxID=2822682 RepID=UPI001B3A2F53|nr:folate-binding protein YgfZ [Pseudoalteromonas sp. MMG005]MBQ4846127.1 folate-binding protein YgfZ [Pseudoalteromonas sp. MMG005]